MELPRFLIRVLPLWFLLLCGMSRGGWTEGLRRGNSYYKREDYEKALEAYQKSLDSKQPDPRLLFNRGNALYRLHRFEEAGESYEKSAPKLKPKFHPPAYYNQGNALYKEGKYAEAVESYKKSLLLDPANEDAKYNLLLAMEKLNRPPQKPQQNPSPQKQDAGSPDPRKEKQRQKGQMSQEDAERILRALSEKEKQSFRPNVPKRGLPSSESPGEDW